MIRLAIRNLFQNKVRLVISAGGVALALLLILALDAIFTGAERRVTAYIDYSGADVIVAQSGVRNMHMASSSLPDSVVRKVKAVPGVASVTPILYVTHNVVYQDERNVAYIIGVPENAEMGGPWKISSGLALPGNEQAIIDRSIAEKSGLELGDEVEIFGEEFELAGLSDGTATLVNSVAFISMEDFENLRGNYGTISYLMVKVKPSESAQDIATSIETQIRDVTAQTRIEFSRQERRVINDMSTDVVNVMNLIGFLIGLAVMALTVYTSTLSRRREYGMLKALGARNRHLYLTVLTQAFLSVILGFSFGLVITIVLSLVIPLTGSSLTLEVSRDSLVKVGGVSLVITTISAVLPIRQIAGLDPVLVFKGI